MWFVGNYGTWSIFWDQECRYDCLVIMIDHMSMRDVLYNKSNTVWQMAWNQPRENDRLYSNHTTRWVLNSYVYSVTLVTVTSLQPYLSPGWFPHRIRSGFRKSCGGEKRNAFALLPGLKHAALSLLQVACFVWLGCVARLRLLWPPATHVGSGDLGRGSLWLNAKDRPLQAFVAWFCGLPSAVQGTPVQSTPGRELVLNSVSWESFVRERWRERAGERLLITFINCIRLTPIFCTVLNYSNNRKSEPVF